MIVKTESIVLNSFKYGETSKIVTLFTKDFGKIKVIAKGSRKTRNKFGSSLEPLSYCQVCFYRKPNTELYLLSDASHIIPLRKLQDSYNHLASGLIIAEAINITQDINEINTELFELSMESIKQLNELPEYPFSLTVYYLNRLTEIIGFAIDFQTFPKEIIASIPYSNGGIKTEKKVFFSIETGSFLVDKTEKNIFIFDRKTANNFYQAVNVPLNTSGKISIDKLSIVKIHDFFNMYISFHLEKKNAFKTMRLIKTIS